MYKIIYNMLSQNDSHVLFGLVRWNLSSRHEARQGTYQSGLPEVRLEFHVLIRQKICMEGNIWFR